MGEPLVRFSSFDDVERALAAFAAGGAPALAGPWTLGQALVHCAQSIEFSLAGYPRLRSALFRATLGRIALRRFLARGAMSHDRAAPIPGAPPLPAETSVEEGVARVRAAIAKFRAHAGALQPHLAFGALGREEYERVHAMHVADHLSNRA